ncbi:hypothetical protein WHT83_05470 [Aminobacter sp. P9b]|uniref:hypothetical protein n=1 Tax=Aminobacter sp. P9b TaxID=3133697 RepID=UPI00324891B4
MIYERGDLGPAERAKLGHRELMENLRWAVDHCDGKLSVIVAIAKDKFAHPRSIAECFPSKMAVFVTELNEAVGSFCLQAKEASVPAASN